MPNLINKIQMTELQSSFKDADGMVFVSLSGLTVEETEGLRIGLFEQGVELRMVRNRIAKIALKERGLDVPEGSLVGNIGCCVGSTEDAINAAKVLHKSDVRKEGKVALRLGMLEGNLLAGTDAVAMASLPGRDELRSKLLSCLVGPSTNLVGLLAAPAGAVARVIKAKVDAGGEEGAA